MRRRIKKRLTEEERRRRSLAALPVRPNWWVIAVGVLLAAAVSARYLQNSGILDGMGAFLN